MLELNARRRAKPVIKAEARTEKGSLEVFCARRHISLRSRLGMESEAILMP